MNKSVRIQTRHSQFISQKKRLGYIGLAPVTAVALLIFLFGQMNALPQAAPTAPTTRYVTETGSGTAACTTGDPCSLPRALSLSIDGDEIRVAGGNYSVNLNVTQTITMSGGFNTGNWIDPDPIFNETILDGGGTGTVIQITGVASPTIEGFTIQNGSNASGAGISNSAGAALIQNNIIKDNNGSGIADSQNATIINNKIFSNLGSNGSGILVLNDGSVVTNISFNEIYSNTSSGNGGGILVSASGAAAFIEGNYIYENTGGFGGGIGAFAPSSVTAQNNMIYANTATNEGGGIFIFDVANIWNNTIAGNTSTNGGGGIMVNNATVQISNTIVASNTGSLPTGIENQGSTITGGFNNIFGNSSDVTLPNEVTTNPDFINYSNFNLHLSGSSLNINAGDPSTSPAIDQDIDQEVRPNDGLVDIGADEHYPDVPNFTLTPAFVTTYEPRAMTAVYTNTLENTGTVLDSYSIVCDNDLGWTVNCTNPVSNLDPGELADVIVSVDVPNSSALTVGTTYITATSTLSPTLIQYAQIRTIIAPNPGVEFTPNYSTTLQPGETITFTHRITNTGDAPDTFDLTVTANDPDWLVEILPTQPYSITLGSGASSNVQVRITVPPYAAISFVNTTIIRATSRFDSGTFATVEDTITAEPTVGTRHVSPFGNNDNNNCTQSNRPCEDIAHALGQASLGDEVRLRDGTYFESGLTINGTYHLSGGWNGNFTEQLEEDATVIDAEENNFIILIQPGSSIQPSISNLTLQNGAAAFNGGAINVGANAQPTINNVAFISNTATQGGAINISGGGIVRITKGHFYTNTATGADGGAIYNSSSTVVLNQSQFFNNSAANRGGAFYSANGSSISGANNLFADGQADNGAGIYINNGTMGLTHQTFVGNNANTNGGAIYINNANLTLQSAIVVNNSAASGSAIHNQAGTAVTNFSNFFGNSGTEFGGTVNNTGLLSVDPLFEDTQYRLALGSPMIDVGNPATTLNVDFEDDFRPTDQGYDIGYDEVVGCLAKRDDTLYGSIQDAIDAPGAVSDLIMVTGICRGVHTIDYNGDIISQTVHLTQTLTIQGGWNGDFSERTYEPTYIDPQGRGRGLFIAGNVQPIVENMIIVNGDATGLQGGPADEDAGGGIYNDDALPTLTAVSVLSSTAQIGGAAYNNTGTATYTPLFVEDHDEIEVVRGQVATNTATIGGAGFYAYSGTVAIDGVEIFNNNAPDGAGIYNDSAVISATNNILAVNTGTNGTGIYNASTEDNNVLQNTFYNNNASGSGGGVYNAAGTIAIRSNIFDSNNASSGSAIFASGGTTSANYNYYYHAANPNFVSGITVGANSIESTTIPPGLTDPDNGDFHLLDEAPAIDAGDPNSPVNHDYEDDPRPSDQGPDMGADETVGCLVRLNENDDQLYGSIQAAMIDANIGDVIDVAGVCSGVHEYDTQLPAGECRGADGTIFTNLHIDKNVILRGGWDEDFANQDEITVLDAEGNGRVVYIAQGITATLEQFHIINGNVNGTNAQGGGICIDSGASPQILNNEIYSNTAVDGGGIYAISSRPIIDKGNRIYNNDATRGAGVFISALNATVTSTIQNNFIYNNNATNTGGGLFNDGGNNNIWQNTIVENTATNNGGAIFVNRHNPDIRGNLIISNTSSGTSGIHGGTGTNPTLSYNDYFANSNDDNVGGSILGLGVGAQTEDPMFATDGYTITINSPVVGLSDPNLPLTHDFEDDIRPSHQGNDMGADEVGGCYARNINEPDTVYGSLQLAVDSAVANDTLEFDGVCLGTNERSNGSVDVTQNLYIDKSLTIDGNNWNFDAQSPLTATLDAIDNGRVVYVQSGATVTLTRMILQNGEAAGAGINNHGGGVYNDGTLILDGVYLKNNNAVHGGAIYNSSDLTMQGSFVGPQNTAVNGAGFYNNTSGGQATLTGQNVISGNLATGSGGAVYQSTGNLVLDGNEIHRNTTQLNGTIFLGGSNSISVWNNFIYKNEADTGAGVYNNATNPTIWHNTILENIAASETGGGIYSSNNTSNIDSNIVDNNDGTGIHVPNGTTVSYNNVLDNFPTDYNAGFTPAGTNISDTPDYVDKSSDDFHLISGSPGEDQGNPLSTVPNDFDDDIRPTNGGPDIGADEINTCLIRVQNPNTSEYEYFGVLQLAINFAESFPELPVVEIARGECRGVVSDDGVASQQVGHVTQDLHFIGSLVRANFSDANDFVELDTYTSILNAEGNGRVILITNGANPFFEQLVFVDGNANAGGGNGNGGGIYNSSSGEFELLGGFICQSQATNGGGYYGGIDSLADISGVRIGNCVAGQVIEDENGGVDGVILRIFDTNEASNQGGGLWSNGRFDLRNVSFYYNTAGTTGGGIYNTGANNRVINGTFYRNEAEGDGGGLYNTGSNFGLYHNTYRNNISQTGNGAAIYNTHADFTLNSSIVYSNTNTASTGFAIQTPNGSTVEFINYYDNVPDHSSVNPVNSFEQNPQLLRGDGTLLADISPAIDEADPSLLSTGAPGVSPYSDIIVDFDRSLDFRPDGDPDHMGIDADMGSDEYFKDYGCAIEFAPLENTVESQANPGDTVVYTFDLINTGHIYPPDIDQAYNGYTDTITLTLQSSSQGWADLEGSPGGTPQVITLGWKDRLQRALTVTVPSSATNGMQEITNLLCESSARPDRTGTGQARTNVGLTSGLEVTPTRIDSAQPGEVITLSHTVHNVGNNTALVQITPSAGPQHASADLVDINGNIITTDTTQTIVTLDPGETYDVLLRVTILDTAEIGDVANPGVVATEIIAENQPVDPLNQGSVIDEITILPAPGTRYIARTSSADTTNCTDPNQPCATIQHAINQSMDGDDILISTGTYTDTITQTVGAETLTQNIFINKSVNLQGGYNVADNFTSYEPITNATYLDGLFNNRVVFITDSITVTISSLFIQNGRPSGGDSFAEYGGGIYNNGANLTITGTFVLTNNARFGAGIYHNENRLLVNSSVLANNNEQNSVPSITFGSGAGIFAQGDEVIIENNTFVSNQALQSSSRPAGIAAINPVGAANGYGGAIFVSTGSLKALNNIFYNGVADLDGTAIYISPTVSITNDYNIYFSDSGWDQFLSPGIVTGTNSVVTDPLFIDSYYHIDTLSPAKDEGTSSGLTLLDVDFELDSRPQGIEVDIGADERFQRPGFEFLPITRTATIDTGDVVTYTHWLTTTGDFADNYTLTMTHQTIGTGFSYTLVPTEVIGLETDQSVEVTLVVTGGIPGGLDVTTITATSASMLTGTVQDTTIISQTAGVDIEQSQTAVSTAPTITYTHTLTNTGDGIDQFELSILSANPPGWNVTLTPTQTGYLTSGQSIPFTVTVDIPPGTLSDTVHVVEIIANAYDPDASDILTDTTTVGPTYGLTLTPDNSSTADHGTTVVYTHTLQNIGNLTDTVTLSYLSTPDWTVDVQPTSVTLLPLETTEIVVSVTVPLGTGGITHTALITATSEGLFTATAVNTTTVNVDRDVLLEPDSIIQGNAGETVTHTHTLTNTGNVTDTFNLTYDSNPGWLVSATPGPFTLGPQMTATVVTTMTIPGGAVPGNEDITVITATSQTDPLVYDLADDTTRVAIQYGLIFTPDRSSTSPDFTVVTYTHYLTNTGNANDTFTLNAGGTPNWPIDVYPMFPFSLDPGEGTQVVVSITVPLGAASQVNTTTLTAISSNPSYYASVIDTTTISGTAGTLSMTITPDNVGVGLPNTSMEYQHTVMNTGSLTATFSLTAVSSNGWNINLPVNNLLLNPLQSQNITLTVDIPAGTLSDTVDVITVTVYPDADDSIIDTATDTTTVGQGSGVIIDPDNAGNTDPNTTITYQHTITNTGNGSDTYTIVATSSQGWLVDVDSPITLGGGLTATVLVTLTVPPNTDELVDTTTITATSTTDAAQFDTAVDTTTVNNTIGPPIVRSAVLAPDNAASDDPGVIVTYQHTLTNTGNITETFTLSAITDLGWATSLVPTNVTLGPGQSIGIVVRVTIPASTVGGEVAVTTVTAVSAAGTTASATDTTTVNQQGNFIYLPIIVKSGAPPVNPTPTPTPTATATAVPCTPTGVDLVVVRIQVLPANPASGQPATVEVTIRNQGSTSVAYGNNFYLDFYVDRVPGYAVYGDLTWGIQGADLTAGSIRTYSAPFTFGGGAHQLYAQVDSDNTVNECPNENNNILGPIALNVSGASINNIQSVPDAGPRDTPTPMAPIEADKPTATTTPTATTEAEKPVETPTPSNTPTMTPTPEP